jgi:hypothetical protein
MNCKRVYLKIAVWGACLVCSIWGLLPIAFADSIVISYCKATKSFGIASRASESQATEVSLRNCNATGGRRVEGCCTVVGTAEVGCIALAVAMDGEFGVDTGTTEMEAISAAVEICPSRGCIAQTARCIK